MMPFAEERSKMCVIYMHSALYIVDQASPSIVPKVAPSRYFVHGNWWCQLVADSTANFGPVFNPTGSVEGMFLTLTLLYLLALSYSIK